MLKIFICEDNNEYRKEVEKIIENVLIIENYDIEIKKISRESNEILNSIDRVNETGIYFLDIDLGTDINGIELASKIREIDPTGFIFFITTHGEMSWLTIKYKVEAMDYIIKEEVENLNEKLHECIKEAIKRYEINKDENKIFVAKSRDKVIRVQYEEIMFFETSQTIHKVKLHSVNRQVEFYAKMKDLEKEVGDKFVRCHNSYLINKDKIKEIDIKNRTITMSNGETCLVSDKGMKLLRK